MADSGPDDLEAAGFEHLLSKGWDTNSLTWPVAGSRHQGVSVDDRDSLLITARSGTRRAWMVPSRRRSRSGYPAQAESGAVRGWGVGARLTGDVRGGACACRHGSADRYGPRAAQTRRAGRARPRSCRRIRLMSWTGSNGSPASPWGLSSHKTAPAARPSGIAGTHAPHMPGHLWQDIQPRLGAGSNVARRGPIM